MAKALGSPMWLLLVWRVIGAMTVSGALCFRELAGRFPSAGGAYIYLKECYGRRIAFLFGWMCLLVMDPAITASLATGIFRLYRPFASAFDKTRGHWGDLGLVSHEHL
jgi:basic amino acid/polyamine antiporter, APA family